MFIEKKTNVSTYVSGFWNSYLYTAKSDFTKIRSIFTTIVIRSIYIGAYSITITIAILYTYL